MSDQQVIYELGLRDKLSAGVDNANTHVNALESSLMSVKGLIAGIGVGLAAFKLGEFVHEANEEWEKMEFSMSQVEAALKSTNEAAGFTFDELKKGAEETAHNLKFTQSEILGMQSVLLTFPKVTRDTFLQASSVIQDMSTRLGSDLKSTTLQVGKALQDPERGITALRKAGVNFTKDQQELIKHLVHTNKAAEAQAMIIKELKFEFEGSALAAAEADKSFRLDKTMEENKVQLGEMIDKLKEELMPILIEVAEGFRDMLVWIKENAGWIKKLGIALGAAWLTFKLFTAGPTIILAIENALVQAAMGASTFGAAMTAALGPVGLLAAAVGGLVYLYQTVGEEEENLANKKKSDFERIGIEERHQMDESIAAYEKTMDKKSAIDKARQVEVETIQAQIQKIQDNMENGKYGDQYNSANTEFPKALQQMNLLNEQLRVAKEYSGLVVPKTKTTPLEGMKPEPKTKATGSKNITITVHIKEMIHDFSIKTTTIKESAAKVKEIITEALTSAINDFQITAGT